MLIKPTIILDMFLLLTHARINKIIFLDTYTIRINIVKTKSEWFCSNPLFALGHLTLICLNYERGTGLLSYHDHSADILIYMYVTCSVHYRATCVMREHLLLKENGANL